MKRKTVNINKILGNNKATDSIPTAKNVKLTNGKYNVMIENVHPTSVTDSFSNPLARMGQGTQNILEATDYPIDRLTRNFVLLNSLYRNNWVVQNIINGVPEDMIKKWFNLRTSLDQKHIEKFDKLARTTNLRKQLTDGMKWGRLYGGAVGLIMIAGQEDIMDTPLDLDTIEPNSFRGLYIIDRYTGVTPDIELVDSFDDSNFGMPKYYDILNSELTVIKKVHHSRIIRFIGRELPYIEKIAEIYWGESEIESIYQEIVKRDNVSYNLAALTFKANLSVTKIKNLDQIFSINSVQAQNRFWELIQAQAVAESSMGIKLLDKEDDAQFLNYTFSGLAEVYNSIMMDVAGASRYPVTKLFGRSPSGLNATGESDLQNYYDYVEEIRERDLRPALEKLLPVMAMSLWGFIPDDLDFEFEAMKTMDELQKSDIVQKRTSTIMEVFTNNLITAGTALKELKSLGKSYGMFDNITDEQIKTNEDKYAKDLQQPPADGMGQDPFMGLMGNTSNLNNQDVENQGVEKQSNDSYLFDMDNDLLENGEREAELKKVKKQHKDRRIEHWKNNLELL